jgi:ABC-type Mn2+/Zn2+ transport system ATPase subunit
MNPKARTTKNKARLKNYDKMLETEVEERDDTVELHIPAGKRLGDTVVRFEKVDYSYDGVNKVVDNLSFEMAPGDILGIVGPNGTGKTTCLKLITGRLQPQSGRVVIGQTVELCHVDQERESLDTTRTVWQEISEGQDIIKLGKLEVNSRSYVAKFNFTGQDQQQLVGSLSGGQRNRVQLAKMLRRGGNLILLDEPTNDLDLDTLRVLEEAIQEFPGCMVVVSHDRYFLDRICTKILDLANYEAGKYLDSPYPTLGLPMRAILTAIVSLAFVASATLAQDKVTLDNGDVLTGKVKTMADGKLTVNSAALGDVVVPMANVKNLQTAEEVHLRTTTGDLIRRRILGIDSGTLRFDGADTELVSNLDKINPPEQKDAEWTGALKLGAGLITGNTERRSVSGASRREMRRRRPPERRRSRRGSRR